MKGWVPSELKFFRVLSRAGCLALLPRFGAASVVNGFGCGMLMLLPRLKRSIVVKPWAAECEPGHTSRSRDTPDRAANPAARTRGKPVVLDLLGSSRSETLTVRWREMNSNFLSLRYVRLFTR
jgi:hypothetical protein